MVDAVAGEDRDRALLAQAPVDQPLGDAARGRPRLGIGQLAPPLASAARSRSARNTRSGAAAAQWSSQSVTARGGGRPERASAPESRRPACAPRSPPAARRSASSSPCPSSPVRPSHSLGPASFDIAVKHISIRRDSAPSPGAVESILSAIANSPSSRAPPPAILFNHPVDSLTAPAYIQPHG